MWFFDCYFLCECPEAALTENGLKVFGAMHEDYIS